MIIIMMMKKASSHHKALTSGLQVGYCIFQYHEMTWFPAKRNTNVILYL